MYRKPWTALRPSPSAALALAALFVSLTTTALAQGGGQGGSKAAASAISPHKLSAKVKKLKGQVADLKGDVTSLSTKVTSLEGQSGAPRPPTGPAGGELAGTYPNPSVGTVSGLDLATSTSPTGGINFGSDTSLYRSGADTLATGDFIDAQGPNVGVRVVDNAVGNTRLFPSGLVIQPLGAGSGAIHLEEATSPTNPYTNTARIYARDNGSGLTQLIVVWPGGDITVLGTDPSPF